MLDLLFFKDLRPILIEKLMPGIILQIENSGEQAAIISLRHGVHDSFS